MEIKYRGMKTLLMDLETAPALGYYFDLYKEGNIVSTKIDWYILSFAYKWLDKKRVHAYALPDFKSYKKNKECDKELVTKLHELISSTDVLVAHNGDNFDMKKSNSRFLVNGLSPIPPVKTVDTLKLARKYFAFDSNRLNDLCKLLGFGEKIETGGKKLWIKCLNGDMKAWKKMVKYNKHDVVLLEKIYLKLRSWNPQQPNANLFNGTISNCPACGSDRLHCKGFGS